MSDEPVTGNTDREIEGLDRLAEAFSLRKTGKVSYRELAKRLNCSPMTAWRLVKKAVWLHKDALVEDYRQSQLDLLAMAISVLVPQVANGNMLAIDRLIKLIHEQAELVGSLAPISLRAVNINLSDDMWEKLPEDMLRRIRSGESMDVVLQEAYMAAGILPAPVIEAPTVKVEPEPHVVDRGSEQIGPPNGNEITVSQLDEGVT